MADDDMEGMRLIIAYREISSSIFGSLVATTSA
jgi:hypothetical protein